MATAVERRELAVLPTAETVRALTRTGGALGVAVAAMGFIVMVGWLAHLRPLTQVTPNVASMKFAAAVCFFLIGAALACLGLMHRPPCRAVLCLAVLVAAFSAAVLVEYTSGWTLGIDDPFGVASADGSPFPGRPSPLAAFGMLWLAVSVALMASGRVPTGQFVATVPIVVGQASLMGYVFDVSSLYRIGPYAGIALQASVGLIAAGVATLLLRANEGPMTLLAGNTMAGLMIRRLLPLVVIVPLSLGALFVAGTNLQSFDAAFALAVFVTLTTDVGAAVVYLVARQLRRSEVERHSATEVLDATRQALNERDALARKLALSEARLRTMVENSVDAYIQLSGDGRVQGWNRKASEIFGFDREEVMGRPLTETVIPAEHVDNHRNGLAHYVATGEGPVLGQLLHLEGTHKDGRRVPLEFVIWATGDGDDVAFHAFLRDDTGRLATEAEVRRTLKTLEEFTAVAAHDLRSPLTSMIGFAELIRAELREQPGGSRDDQLLAHADRIVRIGQQCDLLVADLLDYATLSRSPVTPKPLDLAELIHDIAAERQLVGARSMSLDIGPLPEVLGDATLLRQLLENLVGNALKYVPAQRDLVLSFAAREAQTPGRAVIVVSDNGDGIPDSDKHEVLEVFRRRDVDRASPGTGLGLAICQQAVERHGGRLWIEDAPGGGSSFCFDLAVRSHRSR